jgi:hypothetical protein
MIRPDGTPHHGEMDGWSDTSPLSILYSRRVESTHWEGQIVQTWEQIMGVHRELERKEDAPLWTFGIAKDLQRRADNVTHATALVYDFDPKSNANYGEIVDVLCLFGLRWWAHSTYSHTEDVAAFRLILPVETAIPADKYKIAWQRVAKIYGLEGGDSSACSISRMYYGPSCAPSAPRFSEQGLGMCVPWDAILDGWRSEQPKPTSVKTNIRIYDTDNADVDRLAMMITLKNITDNVSPDTTMQQWLRAIFAAAEALGTEGINHVEAWSKQGSKYDPKQFIHLRRRLNLG